MTALQKGILWVIGALLWVFVLSIALAWVTFGYLDWGTIGILGLMLVPILCVAAVVMLWKIGPEREEPEFPPVQRMTRSMSERGVRS